MNRTTYALKVDSRNGKLITPEEVARGLKVAASYTSDNTCHPRCPFYREGGRLCYGGEAKSGLHWRKVSSGERGGTLEALCDGLRKLPAEYLFRHNVAGDLPRTGDTVDRAACLKLARAASHLRAAFTYSHHPRTEENLETFRMMADSGLTVNLSAHGLREADEAARTGLPVCTILPADADPNAKLKTPDGIPVLPCAAQRRADLGCAGCGNGKPWCARADRTFIVGFISHGSASLKVANASAQD